MAERGRGYWWEGDKSHLQEMSLAEVLSGVDRVAVELLLNAEQLVVLGQALGARESNEEYYG